MNKAQHLAGQVESEILVGIVTLNRFQKLLHTLTECRSHGFHQIVVVDNGSADGTRDYLRKEIDLVSIFPEQNEGGSGGFARLMRYFYENPSYKYLLLMDDDAFPSFSIDDLRRTLTIHSAPNYLAYACRVAYPDGSLCEMNRPGRNVLIHSPLSRLNGDFHIDDSANEAIVEFAGFVGLILKREAIERAGIVSKQFFIYSDDTYYTLSLSRRGGDILYCPQLSFIHDCKRSSRNFAHHDSARVERDVVNKIVMIREFSRFTKSYVFLYLARLIWKNPLRAAEILRAAGKGIRANLELYRNRPV